MAPRPLRKSDQSNIMEPYSLQGEENIGSENLQAQEDLERDSLQEQGNIESKALQELDDRASHILQAQLDLEPLVEGQGNLESQENTESPALQTQPSTDSHSLQAQAVLSKTESLLVEGKKYGRPRRSVLASFDPLFVQDSETSENKLTTISEGDSNLKTVNDGSKEFVFEIDTLENKFLKISEPESGLITYEIPDLSDKIQQLEEENSKLKLELNSSQHLNTRLELQLIEKEEIVMKMQRELLEKDHASNEEIKELKVKLEEQVLENGRSAKELKETMEALKKCEITLLAESLVFKNNEHNYSQVMGDYDKVVSKQLGELKKVNEEHKRVQKHLANLEMAFSDVHQKYERNKNIINGYKSNEEMLCQTLTLSQENLLKSEEKYELLKTRANEDIAKANQELVAIHDNYETETHKLTAQLKRLEIKISSVEHSLDQKTKECISLSALCDEFTSKM